MIEKELIEVLDSATKYDAFSSGTKTIIQDTIKYVNMKNEFLILFRKKELSKEELDYFQYNLSKELNINKAKLILVYSKLYQEKGKSLDDMIYKFASQFVTRIGTIPNNLTETFTMFDLITNSDSKNRSPKETFLLTYNNYKLFTKVYEKEGLEGITRLYLLNKHIYNEDKSKNIVNLLYKDDNSKEFMDKVVLKLVSSESPIIDYSTKEQAQIITKLFSRRGENLFIKNYSACNTNSEPHIELDDQTIDLLNIDGNIAKKGQKSNISL